MLRGLRDILLGKTGVDHRFRFVNETVKRKVSCHVTTGSRARKFEPQETVGSKESRCHFNGTVGGGDPDLIGWPPGSLCRTYAHVLAQYRRATAEAYPDIIVSLMCPHLLRGMQLCMASGSRR